PCGSGCRSDEERQPCAQRGQYDRWRRQGQGLAGIHSHPVCVCANRLGASSMAALATGFLELPDHIIDPWLGKVAAGSTIATLSPSEPQKCGTGKAMIFDSGEAELVSEGGQKSSNDITKSTQTVEPHKFQKTVRMNEEVLWADED